MASFFTSLRSEVTGETTYTLVIKDADLVRARFDHFDRLLLDDCEKDDATVADKLLGLETVVRRIEEAQAREAV